MLRHFPKDLRPLWRVLYECPPKGALHRSSSSPTTTPVGGKPPVSPPPEVTKM